MKENAKIALIGPVYPYKGGIAHYTGLMYKTLAKKYDVQMISYKMQYPKILFKKEQKDFSNKKFEIKGTDYLINTANPFNIIAAAKKIKKMSPDLIIIQWWHPYFAPCYWLLQQFLKKVRIVFLCHNVFPHERFPLDKFLTKLALKKAYGYIVQSKLDETELKELKSNPNCIFTPHPTYSAFKINNLSRQEARKRLLIPNEEKVLLFFGFVREYKGLDCLLNAMALIKDTLDHISLWVVGDFDKDKDKYLSIIKENNLENCVKIVDGYVPDEEVEKYFSASDVVVLPYKSATQSGIVQIAFGFEKPVIVTNVGGLPDVVTNEKTGLVVEPEDIQGLATAIINFFDEKKFMSFQDNINKEAYKFSWDRMLEVVDFFMQ